MSSVAITRQGISDGNARHLRSHEERPARQQRRSPARDRGGDVKAPISDVLIRRAVLHKATDSYGLGRVRNLHLADHPERVALPELFSLPP